MSIRLENAFVTSVETAANLSGNDATNLETVEFNYRKIFFTVPNVDGTGVVNGNVYTRINVVDVTVTSTASC